MCETGGKIPSSAGVFGYLTRFVRTAVHAGPSPTNFRFQISVKRLVRSLLYFAIHAVPYWIRSGGDACWSVAREEVDGAVRNRREIFGRYGCNW